MKVTGRDLLEEWSGRVNGDGFGRSVDRGFSGRKGWERRQAVRGLGQQESGLGCKKRGEGV